MVSATYTTATSTRSTAAVPPTTRRSRVVCIASASATAMRTPATLTPQPRSLLVLGPGFRHGADHEHRFERRQLDSGLHDHAGVVPGSALHRFYLTNQEALGVNPVYA